MMWLRACQRAESREDCSTSYLHNKLERLWKRPDKITVEFTTFKEKYYIFGNSNFKYGETSKLDIDYIVVSSKGSEVRRTGRVAGQRHGMRNQILCSFVCRGLRCGRRCLLDEDNEVMRLLDCNWTGSGNHSWLMVN